MLSKETATHLSCSAEYSKGKRRLLKCDISNTNDCSENMISSDFKEVQ